MLSPARPPPWMPAWWVCGARLSPGQAAAAAVPPTPRAAQLGYRPGLRVRVGRSRLGSQARSSAALGVNSAPQKPQGRSSLRGAAGRDVP